MDNTHKFDGKAFEYLKGRPDYAKELIDYLYNEVGFSSNSVIADIGAGTGIFSKSLADRKSTVYCVEPNPDMRNTAKTFLYSFENVYIVTGDDKNTSLKEQSVDFVTAAQAFHWFDVLKFKKECRRILKSDGKVVLLWNTFNTDSAPVREWYGVFSQFCPNFHGFGNGIKKDDEKIKLFFTNGYEYAEFDNPLMFTEETFISRSLSASYSLKSSDENFSEYISALKKVFSNNEKNGIFTADNKSAAYIGSIFE